MKHKLFTAGVLLLTSMAPALAQDAPANPLEKEGYRLIFHDEFDGTTLDETKWIDDYNPARQPRKVSATFYEMKDGIVSLIINKKSPNNINEYYMTGFISACASTIDVDSINKKRSKKTWIPREAPHINQYGYYDACQSPNRWWGSFCLVDAGNQRCLRTKCRGRYVRDSRSRCE